MFAITCIDLVTVGHIHLFYGMADIVVVGACNIDQIVYTARLPHPGETVLGNDYQLGFGGKGANQCVAASKLGASVAMISKVGVDDNGKRYLSNLKQCGVNITYVYTTNESCTGVAPITVSDDGNNSIVVFSGANMLLSTSDIDAAASVITSAKMVLCQLEIDKLTTLHALKVARQAGVTTFLNFAPAIADLSDEFFKYSDIICLNESEASALSGVEVVDKITAVSSAKILLAKGAKVCLITLGKDGSVSVLADGTVDIVPGDTVVAKDTTGAGDSFIGAFAYFYSQLGLSNLSEVIRKANTIAGISVTRKGTQSSYPTKDELPSHLFGAV